MAPVRLSSCFAFSTSQSTQCRTIVPNCFRAMANVENEQLRTILRIYVPAKTTAARAKKCKTRRQNTSEKEGKLALGRLQEINLIGVSDESVVDCHPLIREYLRAKQRTW